MDRVKAGSVFRCLDWMMRRWAESRCEHLALYCVEATGIYHAFVHDSNEEGRFLGGFKNVETVFVGGYWAFVERAVKVVGTTIAEVNHGGVSQDF